VGEAYARQKVLRLTKAAPKAPFPKPLLPTKAVAIAVVEPMLFSVYGKEKIVQQRPYEAYLINRFWCLTGTLPPDTDGGTFAIIVHALSGRVVKLAHGR
jgi:hypothetical protein